MQQRKEGRSIGEETPLNTIAWIEKDLSPAPPLYYWNPLLSIFNEIKGKIYW